MADRLYTVIFDSQTVAVASGDVDLFSLDAAAEKPLLLYGWSLDVSSELGDAAEEQLRIAVIRGNTTVGSGGSAATPRPCDDTDVAAGMTARTLDTTVASAGTGVTMWAGGFNVRAGSREGPFPEGFAFRTSGTALLVVRLMAAVVDDVTMSGTAWVAEV